MSDLSPSQHTFLDSTFGNRVNFDPTERRLYGHDIGDIPKMIKPLIGDTVPDAIVQPATEEELVLLADWARREHVPLTPRGKATSGYGGVVPTRHGVVVDFFRMRSVEQIDPEGLTATVAPGISWEQLDRQLAKQDLTLRLYPSSYPSSTVGGWLAQGGVGYGSYAHGTFRENVVSARVVGPDGQVKDFEGADLDLVSDAEGITGMISRVTVRVAKAQPVTPVAVSCPTAGAVQQLLQAVVKADLPVWSASFINPKMADMRNRAPLEKHAGVTVGKRPRLPNAYIALLAAKAADIETVKEGLAEIIADTNATLLPHDVAEHEWEERFNVMVIKRLGPSLIPSEVMIPLENLATFLVEVGAKVTQPVVKEGLMLRSGRDGKPEIAVLGFIPGDQRKLSYNFVFGLSLSITKIAEEHGGRAYATGLYFAQKVDDVLGHDRAARLEAYKNQIDPDGLMNPKKVLRNGFLGKAMQLAATTEPIVRRSGNTMKTEVGERPTRAVKDIPADVAWYAYSCSQCGYCVDTCEQYLGRGWESQSPRGKFYWLREFMEGRAKWDQKMVDTMLVCTTCEMCDRRCSEHMPVEPSWMKLRGKLIQDDGNMTFPPFYMMGAATRAEGNIWAGYRKDRAEWFPEELLEKHGPGVPATAVYFAGCTASYVEPDIGIGSAKLLDAAGIDYTYLGEAENCCATPILVSGQWDLFVETMKKNIEAVKAVGADTVITSCPACGLMWAQVYPEWCEKLGIPYDIEAKHYSEVVSEKIHSGQFSFPATDREEVTVTWHDSCHAGRAQGIFEPPRDLIKAVPNATLVEVEHNREQGYCCGSVLTLLKEPKVAHELGKMRLDEAVAVGADKMLALCPCCEFQLRVAADATGSKVEVIDLAHFAAEALGVELPDPNPEVLAQWAVFEKMIALMTPEGFAELMGTMWPELLDAMPAGMGPLMRHLAKVPGALAVMKPAFPMLFPKLLPGMLPKVLPTMVERITQRIPMPGYMAEQMPTLLPKVMDNLMPHMVHDVVPLVTQPMIDYLKGAAQGEHRPQA